MTGTRRGSWHSFAFQAKLSVQILQLNLFISDWLPINLDGHSGVLRGSVSSSWNCLPSPHHWQFSHRGLQLQQTVERGKMNMSFLTATQNPSLALTYTNAKWKGSIWNPASPFQKLSVNMPGSDATLPSPPASSHFIWAHKHKWSLKIPHGYCPDDLIRILWYF